MQKDIDQLFQDQQHQFDEMPSDLLWDKLEQKLDQQPERRRMVGWKRYMAVAAVSLFALFSLLLINNLWNNGIGDTKSGSSAKMAEQISASESVAEKKTAKDENTVETRDTAELEEKATEDDEFKHNEEAEADLKASIKEKNLVGKNLANNNANQKSAWEEGLDKELEKQKELEKRLASQRASANKTYSSEDRAKALAAAEKLKGEIERVKAEQERSREEMKDAEEALKQQKESERMSKSLKFEAESKAKKEYINGSKTREAAAREQAERDAMRKAKEEAERIAKAYAKKELYSKPKKQKNKNSKSKPKATKATSTSASRASTGGAKPPPTPAPAPIPEPVIEEAPEIADVPVPKPPPPPPPPQKQDVLTEGDYELEEIAESRASKKGKKAQKETDEDRFARFNLGQSLKNSQVESASEKKTEKKKKSKKSKDRKARNADKEMAEPSDLSGIPGYGEDNVVNPYSQEAMKVFKRLIGKWQYQNGATRYTESWIETETNFRWSMNGISLKNGKVVLREKATLFFDQDKTWNLVTKVNGGQRITYYLVEATKDQLIFYTQDTQYPKVIQYDWLSSNKIRITFKDMDGRQENEMILSR